MEIPFCMCEPSFGLNEKSSAIQQEDENGCIGPVKHGKPESKQDNDVANLMVTGKTLSSSLNQSCCVPELREGADG